MPRIARHYICESCQKEFKPTQSGRRRPNKYCSQECYRIGRKGKHTARYVDGYVSTNGYHIIMIDGKAIRAHRHIMEQHLGRPLLSEEVVHHKDHNRLNNNINNLEILPSNSAHRKHHFHGFRDDISKQCKTCLVIKPRTEFYIAHTSRGNTDQHHIMCKDCLCAYTNARYHRLKNQG
jgi:hypothetical protein